MLYIRFCRLWLGGAVYFESNRAQFGTESQDCGETHHVHSQGSIVILSILKTEAAGYSEKQKPVLYPNTRRHISEDNQLHSKRTLHILKKSTAIWNFRVLYLWPVFSRSKLWLLIFTALTVYYALLVKWLVIRCELFASESGQGYKMNR
jgi:hypothetical protein